MPSHWKETKLKHVLSKLSRVKQPNAELLVCSNKGKVVKRGDSKLGLVAESDEIYQGVCKNDLLIHGMDTWHGAIAISDYDGMCTPVVHVCESKQDKHYIAYYLQFMAQANVFKLISNGIRQNTSDFRSWDKVGAIPITLPTISEQQAIVAYLKDKTLKIDQYVAARERERELLESLKQSEIANVVTKGLNPNAPMKDSGIPWIGMIPEHWEVKRLKNYVHLITTASNSITKVGLENIESFTGRYRNTDSRYEGNGTKVNIGDIVYGKLRPYLCKAWIASFECNAVGDFYVFQIADENQMSTGYLHKIFLSPQFTAVCNASTYGARMPRVSSSFMMTLSIPVPPLSEQQTIVTHIDEKLSKIDRCLADLQTEIDYLKEFKQRLISDAVTGQICITNEIK